MNLQNNQNIGRIVLVRFGSVARPEWRQGAITAHVGGSVHVRVGADTIYIHHSVLRRDLRLGRPR